ncbi:unnamed protein product [Prunus armeniaca]|uniref:RBR-type E3 ubiquitin transferase n=1 Tax=Prunus armeniaca TaxID=36596 RepID=A0A6J5Y220_PRUAR|nr:unnamed protein product [Prunus armeniaca]CAB4318457.1 unnamed protein product [Prunus armeniaca]
MAFLNVNFGEVKHDDADGDDHDLFFTPLSSPTTLSPKRKSSKKWCSAILQHIKALLPFKMRRNTSSDEAKKTKEKMNMRTKTKKSSFLPPAYGVRTNSDEHNFSTDDAFDRFMLYLMPFETSGGGRVYVDHNYEEETHEFPRSINPRKKVTSDDDLLNEFMLSWEPLKNRRDPNYFDEEVEFPRSNIDPPNTPEEVDDIVAHDNNFMASSRVSHEVGKPSVSKNIEYVRAVNNNFGCNICFEPKAAHQWFDIKNCSHGYCTECMVNYVVSNLQENVTTIRCPEPDCASGSIEPEDCDWILPQEVFERWESTLCEAAIPSSQKFYCPFSDCSAMLIIDDDGSEVVRQSQCPHCQRLFCAQCKVAWHAEMECWEFQELNDDERGREDIQLRNLANMEDWKRCPNCKFYVEKKTGCNFMKCRCRATFCYRCGQSLSLPKTQRHYCSYCTG